MDYKAYALMGILLTSVASMALLGAAYAQTTSLTVKTDKDSYTSGDYITISGKLTATTIKEPLLIQVFDPQGGWVVGAPIELGVDGSYSYKVNTGFPDESTMKTDGEYTVKVSYKGTTAAETTFQFDAVTGEPAWKTFTIAVGNDSYPVQYMITGGTVQNMVPDEATATLTVTVSSTADGNLQIRLPRNVIESRDGADGKSGADSDFAVFVDEENVDPTESETATDARRTLTIDFAQGTETIEIVGTWAIPEFGAIAAIILAIAIVGIIVATARYGKFNFAPRL